MKIMLNTIVQPKFGRRVKAQDYKGLLTSASGSAIGAGKTVGSAFIAQASGTNVSNIAPGALAAAESAGVSGGSAASAGIAPLTAGTGTMSGASSLGSTVINSTGTPIDLSKNLNAKKVEGPFEAVSTTGGGGIVSTEAAFVLEGSGLGSGSANATLATGGSVLPPAVAAWAGAFPSSAALATTAGVSLPYASGRALGKEMHRKLIDPS